VLPDPAPAPPLAPELPGWPPALGALSAPERMTELATELPGSPPALGAPLAPEVGIALPGPVPILLGALALPSIAAPDRWPPPPP
jgi:hypothetical protein